MIALAFMQWGIAGRTPVDVVRAVAARPSLRGWVRGLVGALLVLAGGAVLVPLARPGTVPFAVVASLAVVAGLS
ncbi:MAG: hypothetical protein ACREM8_02030, partial [Vulcanimicrobiaceae bacterium]